MKPQTYQICASLVILAIIYGIILASQPHFPQYKSLGERLSGGNYQQYLMK